MTSLDLLIRAERMIRGGVELGGEIGIRDGRIVSLRQRGSSSAEHRDVPELAARQVIDVDPDVVVLPGLVDTHVHLCEPGHSDWEGFESASAAAVVGGITTLVDMPIDAVPPTVDVAALEAKRLAAGGRCHVDVGFWGGVIPGNLDQLEPLHRAGVLGFKCFLSDSGDPAFPPLLGGQLEQALEVTGQLGVPLLVHAERDEVRGPSAKGPSYIDYLASQPRGKENLAVAQVIEAARRSGAAVHVVHVSSADVLAMLASARSDGVAVTAETCPHYLTLDAASVAAGDTRVKCAPPVREIDNQDQLWAGLASGVLDLVVSDHSPSPVEAKRLDSGDFAAAWAGITSLQVGLPVTWTAASRRGFSLSDVVGWMADAPARLAGLEHKGRIELGADADLCFFAPDDRWVVEEAVLRHRHPSLVPYLGWEVRGRVRSVLLRGRPIDGTGTPRGQLIDRPSTATRLSTST